MVGNVTVEPWRCSTPPVAFVDAQVSDRHRCYCGLGNLLFMIVAGLSCDAEVVLVRTKLVLQGTPAGLYARRRQGEFLLYTTSLLRNFLTIGPLHLPPDLPRERFRNGVGKAGGPADCTRSNRSFMVRTYAQSPGFVEAVPRLLSRLWWPPLHVADEGRRYNGITNGTCVCLRIAEDFRHRPVSRDRYAAALEFLKQQGEAAGPLFLVGDYTTPWADEWGMPNATTIEANDVAQLAVARHCRNFVLSQSTFHVWLAYVAVRPRHVLVFNDTDVTHTGMHLASWFPRPWAVLP